MFENNVILTQTERLTMNNRPSGAQQQYEDKVKMAKKAEREARKAAIRAEDIQRGIFVPVSSIPKCEPQRAAVLRTMAG